MRRATRPPPSTAISIWPSDSAADSIGGFVGIAPASPGRRVAVRRRRFRRRHPARGRVLRADASRSGVVAAMLDRISGARDARCGLSRRLRRANHGSPAARRRLHDDLPPDVRQPGVARRLKALPEAPDRRVRRRELRRRDGPADDALVRLDRLRLLRRGRPRVPAAARQLLGGAPRADRRRAPCAANGRSLGRPIGDPGPGRPAVSRLRRLLRAARGAPRCATSSQH